MSDNKTTSPFDDLTPEQRERLKKLSSEIRIDKVTVSYSLEGRDMSGMKKSAFYCVTGSRGHGGEVNLMNESAPGTGFTAEESKLVRCLLSKLVVAAVYDDAAKRGIMAGEDARDEAKRILSAYDAQIVRTLVGKTP